MKLARGCVKGLLLSLFVITTIPGLCIAAIMGFLIDGLDWLIDWAFEVN